MVSLSMGSMFDNDLNANYSNYSNYGNLLGGGQSKANLRAHLPAPSNVVEMMLAGLPPSFGTGSLSPPPLGRPQKFNRAYRQEVVDRGNRRINVLAQRLDDITDGRVMPDRDDITIGGARRFDLAILFLDICGFSARSNWVESDQKNVLKIMNMFMAEMLSIVDDFGGTYEKNTGDGLMAYFGENENSAEATVKPAVETAVIMHYVNDHLLTPWFQEQGLQAVTFRVGIDYGPVMIARVGIHGDNSSRVAVGTTANIANKLMNRIPNGGICIGDKVRMALPHNWASACKQCSEDSGFVYVADKSPYTAWELNHRLSDPLV
jgi:adenylate cyclase